MGDMESPERSESRAAAVFSLLFSKELIGSRKGKLLLAETDFLRCITSSIVFFIISIMAVWKYPDGSSKAAGVFGFIATIVLALDFYFIFNDLADFLKSGNSNEEVQNKRDSDSDSD